jgi:hypothetical protein
MNLRRGAGALLAAAAVAACEGPAALVEPGAAGPSMERKDLPPGLADNPYVPFDTSSIHNGYFGSGHHEPPPDTIQQ